MLDDDCCEIQFRAPAPEPKPRRSTLSKQPWYAHEDWRGHMLPNNLVVNDGDEEVCLEPEHRPVCELDADLDEPTTISESVQSMEEELGRAAELLLRQRVRAADLARCASYWYSRFQREQKTSETLAKALALAENRAAEARRQRDGAEEFAVEAGRRARATQDRLWRLTISTGILAISSAALAALVFFG